MSEQAALREERNEARRRVEELRAERDALAKVIDADKAKGSSYTPNLNSSIGSHLQVKSAVTSTLIIRLGQLEQHLLVKTFIIRFIVTFYRVISFFSASHSEHVHDQFTRLFGRSSCQRGLQWGRRRRNSCSSTSSSSHSNRSFSISQPTSSVGEASSSGGGSGQFRLVFPSRKRKRKRGRCGRRRAARDRRRSQSLVGYSFRDSDARFALRIRHCRLWRKVRMNDVKCLF